MKTDLKIKSFLKANLFMLVFLISALGTLVVSTVTIISMSSTTVSMNSAKENMDTTEEFLISNYEQRLMSTVAIAQNLLGAGDLDALKVRPNSPNVPEAWRNEPEFIRIRGILIDFAAEYGLEYVYYYSRLDNNLLPLIDNDPNLDTAYTPSSAFIPLNDDARRAWNDRCIVLAAEDDFVDSEGLMTAYAPVINYYGEVVALVGVDIKDVQINILREQIFLLSDRIESLTRNMTFLIFGMILALALLITGGVLTFIANRRQSDVLKEALADAENANRAKSGFLANMSHEIRTPLNAIIGITEIQLQNEAIIESSREALEKISNSGGLLLGIINDILDLSKIEAGKLELIIGNYEIASLINDTAQLNIMRIGSKPIEFELDVDANIPSILSGDELRVKQILSNLLSNAFKYTAKGLVRLMVSSETESTDSSDVKIIFSVSDTGQGMTEAQVNQLFDEYSRFNQQANRTTEGTGLGMSITKNLVRLMNGEISVESEPGKGSLFTVSLPQGKVSSEVLGKELADNLRKFRDGVKMHSKREALERDYMPYGSVLIVDDVEMNIYVAKGLMAPYGLKIDSADSGFAAIDKVNDGNVYDIIFMDHMMPKMDGIEATKIIRESGYSRPIVALTANAVVGQSDIFLSHGFDDFVSKPIDMRQLNTVLNKLIRDKQPPEVLEDARRQAEKEKSRDSGAAPQGAAPAQAAPSSGVAGRPVIDPVFAEVFVRDAKKVLAVLDDICEREAYGNEEDLRAYIINVHGIKGALANLRIMDLSAAALKLETASREGDLGLITSETPGFIDSLRTFTEGLIPDAEGGARDAGDDDTAFLHEKLLVIKAACEEYDENAADAVLSELKGMTWSRRTKDLLDAISEYLLHSDFDEAVQAIEEYNTKL